MSQRQGYYGNVQNPVRRTSGGRRLSATSRTARRPVQREIPTREETWFEQAMRLPVARQKEVYIPREYEPPYLQRRISSYKPQGERRGSQTRGWRVDAPKPGTQRHQLRRKCGDACFLIPGQEKFPICPRDRCELDCRGLAAAKVRAHQWGYEELYEPIERLQRAKCPRR